MQTVRVKYNYKYNGLSFMKFTYRVIFTLCVAIFISACVSSTSSTPSTNEENLVQLVECTDPRPQICTREYMPVCATKDTGIKCVGKQCPTSKKVTYATGCTACADQKVRGYMPGECDP